MSNPQQSHKYPLLEELLAHRQMALQPIYTVGEVARLFEVTTRCIQAHVAAGHLVTRTLPGRGKFLAVDLEGSLQKSGGAR